MAAVVPGGDFRDRHRESRRQEFLTAAREIVSAEGIDALTMQRVTNAVGCAEGTIYNYFASKDVLLAELQHEALDTMAGSVLGVLQRLSSALTAEVEERVRALAPLLLGGWAWVDSEEIYPREVELCRRYFTYDNEVFSEEAGQSVAASARVMFEFAGQLFDEAVTVGALQPGSSFGRAVALLAGTTGILLTARMARWDARLLDARAFARDQVRDLLLAWGADPALLREAETVIEPFVLIPGT